MKAVVTRGKKLIVDEVPEPKPEAGQLLVKTLACGICGSDLHALSHGEQLIKMGKKAGGGIAWDSKKDVIFGHEFVTEILDHGPGCEKTHKVGSRVVSFPIVMSSDGVKTVGYSNDVPGGYGERMILSEGLVIPVPDGLPTDFAALTEPMAVGNHAVAKAQMTKNDVAMVVGCGPIGLAVIMCLKAQGFGPVIASDYSALRRKMAETVGADVVLDPAENSPHNCWADHGVALNSNENTMNALAGITSKTAVVFECVGVPGVIQEIIEGIPLAGRIVVVGVCMEEDRFEPGLAITKTLDLSFVLGYTPEEFESTLHLIADGKLNVEPIITGKVDLDGVPQAFEDLKNAESHAKILVCPYHD
jgi:threonine dehydrogenase-like Zn-dependent dehydrogenase